MRSLNLHCLPHEIMRLKRQGVGKPFVKAFLPECMDQGSSAVFTVTSSRFIEVKSPTPERILSSIS